MQVHFSEEGNYHSVTPLEQLCNAITFAHIFVNNKCFTLHPELKTYLSAKSSCTDLPGISGYLAQPRNSSDLSILDNLLLASCLTEIFPALFLSYRKDVHPSFSKHIK
jgi:hypothetical protein